MASADMTSSTGSNGFDPMASYARLSERVEGQGRDIVDLRSNMNTGFRNLENSIGQLATEYRSSTRTPWALILTAIGVAFAILAGLGGALYAPVRENITQAQLDIRDLAVRTVSRQEMDWRQARGQEDRLRTEGAISDMRAGLVPRAEHERVWSNYDQRFSDQQRQIDEIKAATAGVYNARDVILDLRERLDRVERARIGPP